MASTKKNNKKTTPPPATAVVPVATNRPRQVRLALGTFFMLAGVFTCFAVFSYLFTWKTDQDLLLRQQGLVGFLLHDRSAIANWGGRLGAAISHLLVYRGVGIAAFAIGIWIASLGLNMIYGKKVVPLLRYLRWLALVLLVTAPILSYLFPSASFPFGGAWGNESVAFLNGFLGKAGTGMTLLAVACFFLFVVLALDISPMIRRARRTARNVVNAITPEPVQGEEEDFIPEEKTSPFRAVAPALAEEELSKTQDPAPITSINNKYNGNDEDPEVLIDNGSPLKKEWNMGLVEKEAPVAPPVTTTLPAAEEEEIAEAFAEEENDSQETLEYQKWAAEQETIRKATPEPLPEPEQPGYDEPEAEEPELTFEVTTVREEEPTAAIAHGAHISVEDNEPYAPELDLPDYKFPTLDLLEDRAQEIISLDKEELEKNKNQIINTLKSFGIEIQRISATVGPTVTLYEIVPAEGVRISKIRNLEDDIALNLAALGIRIIAPIPGRGTIGIEVPNAHKQIVSMRALLASDKFVSSKMSLPIALGKKIDNENYIVDLATMPHLLMAGATGQGKSVGINAILVSLLYKKHPSQLKFVMVDPKKVELSIYRTIEKHFLAKLPNEEEAIITDTKKVIYTLNALCIEMDNRYELLKEAGARNIKEYNDKFIARRLNPERGHKFLPFIVLVVDEFADLIMTAGKEVEMPIARLAQLARAVGIHLIIATQRPSVNVITGTIKANFPGRVAFKVSAKVDSRTILDTGGAEQLVGRGDMLVSHGSEVLRLQCAFVDTPEVEKIVDFIGVQRGYLTAFELPEYEGDEADGDGKVVDLVNRDKLFEDCARVVVSTQSGSTSMLQRRFNLGYNRAGRIMDQLEAANIVGPAMGSKPREVYFKTEAELEQFLQSLN